MNLELLIWLLPVLLLLLLLAWSLRRPHGKLPNLSEMPLPEINRRSHLTYFCQVRMSLAPTDFDYLAAIGRKHLARRLRRERRHSALIYLSALRADFEQAVHMIRVVAMLSPDLAATHELERFRLSARFYAHYYVFRLRLRLGLTGLSHLDRISGFVGRLGCEIEQAILEMSERAAMANEITSAGDRGGAGVG